jgi:hypothetical protein
MQKAAMNKIRFLHVPKTAGTSLTDCLNQFYKNRHYLFSGDLEKDKGRYQKISASKRAQISLFSGHAPRITGIPEIDILPTITFFRDPVERVKSFCQHVSEGKSRYLLKDYPPAKFSLDEFLNNDINELSNIHTKLLLCGQKQPLPETDPQTIVETAVNVLKKDIVCFGITEQFDRSLLLFHYKLGWKKWPVYKKLNVKNQQKLIVFTDNNIKKIRELNEIDIAVYNKALDLFTEELSSIAGTIESNWVDFQKKQRAFQPFLLWAIFMRRPIKLLKRIFGLLYVSY